MAYYQLLITNYLINIFPLLVHQVEQRLSGEESFEVLDDEREMALPQLFGDGSCVRRISCPNPTEANC
jgi:hypothetical protein